jgi:tRNA dimethylallyltransferase
LFDILQIGIKPQENIEERINKRVDRMIKEGLEKEVKKLDKYPKNPILETIGYREWKEYKDEEEIIERIKINTRKFAKRQMTWFKRDKTIHWTSSYVEAKKIVNQFIKKEP